LMLFARTVGMAIPSNQATPPKALILGQEVPFGNF